MIFSISEHLSHEWVSYLWNIRDNCSFPFRIQEWIVSIFRQFRCPQAEVLQMHSHNHLRATRSCVLRALPIMAFYILLIFRRGVHMSFVY